MPAEKLFWTDPYMTQCDAHVTGVAGQVVTLDRTVAYAVSGGQVSDAGTIDGLPILSAVNNGLDIDYTLPEGHGLGTGDPVTVVIDWPRRYRLMRLHFAAELVLALMRRHFPDAEKLGAGITPEKARIDFAWTGSIAEVLPLLEREVGRIVDADLPIVSAFDDETTQRRYWEIEGFARVPCGGTHPARTGEVGAARLKRVNPGAGKERIEIRLADD